MKERDEHGRTMPAKGERAPHYSGLDAVGMYCFVIGCLALLGGGCTAWISDTDKSGSGVLAGVLVSIAGLGMIAAKPIIDAIRDIAINSYLSVPPDDQDP